MSSSSAFIEEPGDPGLARPGASQVADAAMSSVREIEILVGRMVANAQRDADELRAQARHEASVILEEARRDAARLLAEARSLAAQERLGGTGQANGRGTGTETTIDRETISALVAYLDDAGAIQRRITSTVRAAIEAALATSAP